MVIFYGRFFKTNAKYTSKYKKIANRSYNELNEWKMFAFAYGSAYTRYSIIYYNIREPS